MHEPFKTDTTEYIEVYGAREHNLKNIHIKIPRNKLVVLTGISGSGKSSLAFDTIYAEGQRRYMESFSAYARSFIGDMERADVDKIDGLSPVISIEQKTTSKNPRSTVGTLTEIYDFFRLLYARAADAYSFVSGKKMEKQSEDQIVDAILQHYEGKKIMLLAPIVRARKGHYREEFQKYRKMGFIKARVDGEVIEIGPKTETDRFKIHDIEIVIDRIVPKIDDRFRLSKSVQLCLKIGKGVLMLLPEDQYKVQYYSTFLMDPEHGISYDEPAPNLFSFNSPYGWCPTCEGLGVVQNISEATIIPDKNLSISRGGILPLGEYRDVWIFNLIESILKSKKQSLSTPIKDLPKEVLDVLLYGSEELFTVKKERYAEACNSRFEGLVNYLKRQQSEGSEKIQDWIREFAREEMCPDCKGQRLKREALHFKIHEKNIAEVAKMDISELSVWLSNIEHHLSERQNQIAKDVLKEIRKRVGFLLDVGLEYLSVDRPINTLSGGESQRIRLATQVGTQLVGVLYILDEPSIGLHQRDNEKLIQSLIQLRELGNSVLVVEHDRDMMLASDYIIDVGPGAGIHGGQIITAGTPAEIVKSNSTTASYLNGKSKITLDKKRTQTQTSKKLILEGARGNNLKNVRFELPLSNLVCVTGVSGSGKSTLIHDTLYPILNKHFYRSKTEPLPYKAIYGLEYIDKVIEIDQSPIGRTPRSNPATYTGVFSDIRQLFAQMPEAKIRGYNAGRFSFNVKGGRCETCQGGGMRIIEMEFLPDVLVPCETCKGKRYNRETLDIRFKGKSIADVLDLTVEQAIDFFSNQPKILRYMETLADVGLGYIKLGQHATTLSGGEAQRVKLATELAKKDTGKTLYILDEPTTGLHFQDIAHLMHVLNKLVDKGNTVLIIEHNMDVIRLSDWIIDIGPESGKAGGEIVVEGTPEQVAACEKGYTGKYLKLEMERVLK